MKNLYCLLMVFLCICSANAGEDCLRYKRTPKINFYSPNITKSVVQPRTPMNLLHGNVVATLVDNYEIVVDVNDAPGGYCVALKGIDAIVGYSEFLVQIDIRHAPKSCAYNVILSHEDKHIDAYLSVMDDLEDDINASIKSAADSIMPIFVKTQDDIDSVIDEINDAFQSHPDLILIKQKIKAAEEIRNKRVDENDSDDRLNQCF